MVRKSVTIFDDQDDLFEVPIVKEKVVSVKSAKETADEIQGKITNLIFSSGDFKIYGVEVNKERFTMKINSPNVFAKGEEFIAQGSWGNYKGEKQFVGLDMQFTSKDDKRGLKKWFENCEIEGLKKSILKKLLKANADDILEWIEQKNENEKQFEFDSIVPKDVKKRIFEEWNSAQEKNSVFIQLSDIGFTVEQIKSIFENVECKNIIPMLKSNPWFFVNIPGITFKAIDKYFRANHGKVDDFGRINAGVLYAISTNSKNTGSTKHLEEEIIENAVDILSISNENILKDTIDSMVQNKTLVRERDYLYSGITFYQEKQISTQVAKLLSRPKNMSIEEATELIETVSKNLNFKLDSSQIEAAKMALVEPISIITGGPGTGKSTIQKVIVMARDLVSEKNKSKNKNRSEEELLSELEAKYEKEQGLDTDSDYGILLAAPTGKAAKRLSETTKKNARTVHGSLAYNPKEKKFKYNSANKLPYRHIIVDEGSMADNYMSWGIFSALETKKSSLTIVGDVKQLASVAEGNVLSDLINCGLVPVTFLDTTHRQDNTTDIIQVANLIDKGIDPCEVLGDKIKGFVFKDEKTNLLDKCLNFIRNQAIYLGLNPSDDIQFMSSKYEGEDGINKVNSALKTLLNPVMNDGRSLKLGGKWYTIGDRVMQTANSGEIKNGEVGKIKSIIRSPDGKDDMIIVDFYGYEKTYNSANVLNLNYGWCFSIHKSQGSEFLNTVIFTPQNHVGFLEKSLIYTAVTRTKDDCMIIGDRNAFLRAIKTDKKLHRKTGLKEKIIYAVNNNFKYNEEDYNQFQDYKSAKYG